MFPIPFFPSRLFSDSKWLVFALIAILSLVILSMALVSHHRTENQMLRILQEKGQLLARSLEAGTRTGMMGRLGETAQLRTLFEETAALPDILYILLSDPEGRILLGTDPEHLGKKALSSGIVKQLAENPPQGWAVIGSGEQRHFLFHQTFTPLGRPIHKPPMPHMPARSTCGNPFCGELFGPSSPPLTLVVGMDIRAFDAAIAKDIRQSLTLVVILMLLAISAIIALFRAEALRHSRLRLRDTRAMAMEMIRSFPAGLLVLDAVGCLRFANEKAETLLEKPLKPLMGKAMEPHLPEILKPLIRKMGNKIHESEVLLPVTPTPIPISISISPIRSQQEILGQVLILQDLSEIRRLEEEVRRKEKLAAVGQLAAGVAHEIRNPLSSIKGFATHFRYLFTPGSPNHEAADILIREVNRMDRVIGELLEFARPSDIRTLPSLPEPLIRHTLKLIEPDVKNAGIRLESQLSPLPEVALDPDRITQVLLNLYLNAIQAMEKNGVLTVKAFTEGEWLWIHVQDTGCGMKPEDIPRIFDPFYTTKSKGTGLGLAVVEKIVSAHGGHIQVSSPSEGGTCFSLCFPL